MSKILIMEDDAVQALAIGNWLEKEGHEAVITHTESDAFEKLRSKEHFDLLITDIFGPEGRNDIAGLTLINTIRGMRDPRRKTIPIISISGTSLDDPAFANNSITSNAHLSKPLDAKLLIQKANELIAAAPG